MRLVVFERTSGLGARGRDPASMGAAAAGFEVLEGVRRGQRRLGALLAEGAQAGAVVDLNSALALQLAEEDAGAPEAEADSQLPADPLLFLRRWPESLDAAQRALAFVQDAASRFDAPDLAAAGVVLDRRAMRASPPVPRPGKIVGLRHEGTAESAELFLKAPSAIAGPNDELRVPGRSPATALHGELALVIGRRVHAVPPERALECVAGYCPALAVAAPPVAAALATLGWSRDGSAPIGPALVTADEVSELGRHALELRLSGKPVARACTGDFALPLAELVALASRSMTLEPGDVLLSGPPLDWPASPLPRALKDGDVLEFEIEGLGRLSSYVQAKD